MVRQSLVWLISVFLIACASGTDEHLIEDEYLEPLLFIQFDELEVFNNKKPLMEILNSSNPLYIVTYASDFDGYEKAYRRFQAIRDVADFPASELYVLEPDIAAETSLVAVYQTDAFNITRLNRYRHDGLSAQALDISSYRNFFYEAFRRSLSLDEDALHKQLASIVRFYGWNLNFHLSDSELNHVSGWSVRRLETVFAQSQPSGYELSMLVSEVLREAGFNLNVRLNRRNKTIEVVPL